MIRVPRSFSVLLASALILWAPAILPAQTPTITGHWEGAIELPGAKLAISLDFADLHGVWIGTITIPSQNLTELTVSKLAINGKDVSFELTAIPGTPTFKGILADDGASLAGKFSQAGQTFAFALKRAESPAVKAASALASFDAIAEAGLKALKVPGTAMAVIVGDQVVLAKGWGYRDVEKKLPMTADTLLAIGSATKAFTAFTLGTLVDEGKADWDKPVRTYIPWFKLYDPSATERITPRDLVTHRSGLPRHDLVWYNNFTSTREDLVRRLAFLPPTADLRERFQYNNLMFLTAGYLIETLTGGSWEEAVRTRVFAPLGMVRTNFSVDLSQKDADFALPYAEEKGTVKRIPFRNITTVGPAGAINSSAKEMSRWVRVHLGGGKFEGKELIGPATLADMHAPPTPLGVPSSVPEISPEIYGMGWFTDVYRGRARVHHGGNIDGFSALVAFLPQDNVGFVVLTNLNGTALPELLVRHATDAILGLPARNWIAEAAQAQAKAQEAEKAAADKAATRRVPGTKPSHKLEDYVGDYVHPGYGDLKVTMRDGHLAFAVNGILTDLEHWHYDTFNGKKIEDPTFEGGKPMFRTNANGYIAAVEAPVEPSLEDASFMRKPDARLSDPDFLKKLEGTYETGAQRLTIVLKGKALVIRIPGQPELDLVPSLGGEFALKQSPGVAVVFKFDDKGAVTGADMIQPNGVFEAKRIREK